MDILESLRRTLQENTDEKTIALGPKFFKEEIKAYGVKNLTVKKIGKEYFRQIESRGKSEILSLCEQLFSTGNLEESFIACEWSYEVRDQYEPQDFDTFERWVDRYVHNWASCDSLCNHSVGDLVMMYPELVERLRTWTRSENRWMRRGAAVTLIIPARKGLFLPVVFDIADSLLADPDDLVQKGYGWMLKAAGQAYPEEVFGYLIQKKAVMPRTAYRYALEKLPPGMRAEAMRKD